MCQILHTINGINYVLIDVPVVDSKHLPQIRAIMKKYKCINQSIKRVERGGLFNDPFVIMTILVPEKNIMDFNDEEIT